MAQRKTYRKIYQKNRKKVLFFSVLKLFGLGCLLATFIVLFVFVFYAKDLPRPEIFTEKHFIESTKIYDRTGKVLLYEIYGEEKRTIVSLENIPEYLKQAVIVTEDANFYHHFGIDFEGILRSILINLKIGRPVYGGSTIPQQLIRSAFFTPEKTIERKIREIILALELDRRYSKDEILGWYLNQIPLGQNAYGVESASQIYFNKPVSDITMAESAVLAALIQAPYHFSPYGEDKDKLLARKDYVLERMLEEGFLTKENLEIAKEEIIEFKTPTTIKAPHFVLYIIENYLKPKYGQDLEYLKENGVKIYTSLDWELQELAEKVIKEGVERNKIYNAYNAALVAINPENGEILAMVGSADWYATSSYPQNCTAGRDCLFDPKFNVAIGTKESPGRQPGSAFKPFIYATAFEKGGYDDRTKVTDEASNFGVWGNKEYTPQNYDGMFRGWVNLRQGLAQSLNIPSIKVLFLAGLENKVESLGINNFLGLENVFLKGLENSIETAKNMGITTLNKPLSSYGPAIVLGGGEVKLLDMASAYGAFATEGLAIPPVSVLKIEDYDGNTIEKNKKTLKRVLPKDVARLINNILSDNEARTPMFGARSHLYFDDYQVAAKTGTTDNFRDAWTIGYTPSIVVGVWVGNNNNAPMIKKQPAATVAGPIFHDFLKEILLELPKEQFTP
ncbi:MAG: transglycosylase domain-containing protein [Candidatus Nealsonbacteria bacterium]|nr:transglycosylase domain-containing protein [Candidatus Nealsonbacteria bacterium]